MGESARSNKLKKKNRSNDIKSLVIFGKGSRSPRLEMKVQKYTLLNSGSAFTAIIARRDDKEIGGAMASLHNKSLEELKKKYKKYKRSTGPVSACRGN